MSPLPTISGVVHVVDDDNAFRAGLGRMLVATGYQTRLYASAAQYLMADISEHPACLILDLRMPGPNGLDLQGALTRRPRQLPVIFLTGHGDIPSSVRAMRAGAVDFLTKPVSTVVLLDAISRAFACDLERESAQAQLELLKQRYASLTPRERQVMAGVVVGQLNKQISYALDAAERTVKTHRSRVMRKMEVRSVAQLVRLAEELVAGGVELERVPGE